MSTTRTPDDLGLTIATLAERPDLAAVYEDFPGTWPEFMYHDGVSAVLFEPLMLAHPDTNLIAIEPGGTLPVARACALPYAWPGDPDAGLHPNGYDHVLLTAAAHLYAGPPIACALEITIRPDHRGRGLSSVMIGALRDTLARLGYRSLVAPVRPNRKHEHPDEPLTEYVRRTRPDGLSADPWIRTHVRAGARIVGVAPASMTVTAPLADWRAWTGLPFDAAGPVYVPDALVPVHCDPTHDIATYVEPNVWMHHKLG